MRVLLFLILLMSNFSFAIDINQIDKSKAVWTDFSVQLNHQVALMVAFSRVNNYLCVLRDTDYKNNSNLKDPSTSEGIGYKAIVDDVKCGTAKQNSPWVVKSDQVNNADKLVVDIFNPSETTDTRARIEVREEASASNPYGKIKLNWQAVTKPDADPLYLGYFDSTDIEKFAANSHNYISSYADESFGPPGAGFSWISNAVQFKTAVLVDSVLINPSQYSVGQSYEFYGSLITHVPNVGGIGVVNANYWDANFADPGGVGFGNFPDGKPYYAKRVRFAYNNEFVHYHEEQSVNAASWIPDTSILGKDKSFLRCLKRNESWTYVPSWFGYGVYDSNGDRLTGTNLNISVNYSGPIQTNSGTFSGPIKIDSGSSITVGYACKKVKDGTHYNSNDVCPGTVGQVHLSQTINGEEYENFPLLDIPDGTVLTDNLGNKYYVRQLRPRIVYAEYDSSNCASLDLPDLVGSTTVIGIGKLYHHPDTPDHTDFPYPTLEMPNSGAILVNKLSSKSSQDSYASGAFFNKNEDTDGDGVSNLLDAFPSNSSKTANEGLYSSSNNFQPLTDGPLPKRLDKTFFVIPRH